MLNKINAFIEKKQFDMIDRNREAMEQHKTTLQQAIENDELDAFVDTVELVGRHKQAKEQCRAKEMEYLKTPNPNSKKSKKGYMFNNMWTRDFIRENVDKDIASVMTLMSKPALQYKIKKTISNKLFK